MLSGPGWQLIREMSDIEMLMERLYCYLLSITATILMQSGIVKDASVHGEA